MSNATGYPFMTKKQIQLRVVAEPEFMKVCSRILQTRTEQGAAGAAPPGNPWGWMSSERVVAGKLVAKSRIGMLSDEEESRLAKLVMRYSKQLADHFRAIALQENPALSAAAEKYGVDPTASDPSDIPQAPPESKETPEQCYPSGEPQPDELEDDLDTILDNEHELVEPEPEVSADDVAAVDDDVELEPVQGDELAPRVIEFVAANAGQRTDVIAKALDVTTAMIGPTLRMWLRASS